jgi:hypothetical protein
MESSKQSRNVSIIFEKIYQGTLTTVTRGEPSCYLINISVGKKKLRLIPFSKSVPARENADNLVDRHISELKDTCNEMTQILFELCELQPLIQTAQALDLVGPQRELRTDIL